MNTHRSLAWLVCLVTLTACLPKKDSAKERTREEFCEDWAVAACSKETVSVCQAENAEACHQSQEDFCRSLVPERFSDVRGQECIDAVRKAYADADLRDDELAIVLSLGAPCDELIVGPKDQGESCTTRSDCDASSGFDCIRKANSDTGTCQLPVEVAGGRSCSAAQKICAAGFYCDGNNCIEAKDNGESCSIQEECSADSFCNDDGKCATRLKIGTACSADLQCKAGICYEFEGDKICTDRIVLSRTEPVCENLR
jgi:hypothetical protein